MSTNTFVHIPVDAMEIVNGPGYGNLKKSQDVPNGTVTFTLKSAASDQTFRRKAYLFAVVFGYEDSEVAAGALLAEVTNSLDHTSNEFVPKRDMARFNGFIGSNWFFYGTYNFHTRKGMLQYSSWEEYEYSGDPM